MSDKQKKTTPATTEVDDERMQAEQLLNDINSGNISINKARSVLGLSPLANQAANLKYIASQNSSI
ncbi:hypothetical protein [Bacillus pumilus]|uniref:hypothetical protein n=1 Tax=Bacillus pumilus TaxID=1408 RepID=UPI0007EEF49F|nr:hypothetical protein [Bacillus pumilus]MBU8574968.1 hypothetical protein [Bacillus pumilus]OBS85390.1 hypothetical protein BAY68_06655 [Bacillus pumilus]